MPFSTIRFEISPSPVSAVIVTHRVMSVPAFVMNTLAPFTTQLPSRSLAVVRVAPASEPASGSVSPNAASRSPRASGGIHSRFCSSVPKRKIGIVPSEVCAATRDRDRRIDAGELLDRDRVRERVAACASELLRERDPHQAEVGHLRDELVREARLAVELLGDGCDAVDCEPADRLAEELVLGRKVEVHARRSYPEQAIPTRR